MYFTGLKLYCIFISSEDKFLAKCVFYTLISLYNLNLSNSYEAQNNLANFQALENVKKDTKTDYTDNIVSNSLKQGRVWGHS
jgi:spore coat protein CotF